MVLKLDDKEWFTVEEVAAYLGENAHTVYRWIRFGRLKAQNHALPNRRKPLYRVGRSTLVTAMKQKKDGLPVLV